MSAIFQPVRLLVVLLAIVTLTLQPAAGQNNQSQRGRQGQAGRGRAANATATLSQQEIKMLLTMREEEKLAHDVYVALGQKWNEQVFQNISQAESQHANRVAKLLAQYQIPDPVAHLQPGVFASPNFQKLYQTLVTAGTNSRVEAIQVGLKIEELDIADLKTAIQTSNQTNVQRVLENLHRGSRNHLRAFASRLQQLGGTYVPTSLSQQEFNEIVNSAQERGGPNQGAGQGQNNQRSGAQGGQQQGGQGQSGRGKRRGRGRGKN